MKKILFVLIIGLVLYFGGFNFIKTAINNYNNPEREKMIKNAEIFGNFAHVSSDYTIKHTYNIFGYKILKVEYKPSGQKIIFFDFKEKNPVEYHTFNVTYLNKTLQNLTKNNFFEKIYEKDFKITPKPLINKEKTPIKNVEISLIGKIFPHKKEKIFIGILEKKSSNKKSKTIDNKGFSVIVISKFDEKKYSYEIVKNLLQKVDF